MVQSIAISEHILTLSQIQEKFGFERAQSEQFFTEWQMDLPEIAASEKERLDRVKGNYLYQRSQGILLEETIKMVLLSPLLELAGFYQAPFTFWAEVSIEIEVEGDNTQLLKGGIDALVFQQQFWVVLVEAKKATLAVELALPQTLAYMAANPHSDRPLFGMISNGSEFIFIKLFQKNYELSDLFSLLPRRNQLYDVLRILRRIGGLIGNK
ncbi:MAG: hypothetical protein Fur006_05340 [Coleofasciculaceae cyanobacterium]